MFTIFPIRHGGTFRRGFFFGKGQSAPGSFIGGLRRFTAFVGFFATTTIVLLRLSEDLDYKMLLFLNSLARNHDVVEQFAVLATLLGSFWFWVAILVPAITYLVRRRAYRDAARIILTWALAELLVFGFKDWVSRPRPYEITPHLFLPAGSELGSAFPSGHATRAAALSLSLSQVFKQFQPLSLIINAIVPLSRVMLGVHYPTDVTGGFFLGVALFQLSHRILTAKGMRNPSFP